MTRTAWGPSRNSFPALICWTSTLGGYTIVSVNSVFDVESYVGCDSRARVRPNFPTACPVSCCPEPPVNVVSSLNTTHAGSMAAASRKMKDSSPHSSTANTSKSEHVVLYAGAGVIYEPHATRCCSGIAKVQSSPMRALPLTFSAVPGEAPTPKAAVTACMAK